MKKSIPKKILFSIGLLCTMGLHAQIEFPTFTDITPAGTPQIFRGNAVWGDYNNDGLMDIVAVGRDVSGGWAPKAFLLKNNGSGGFDRIDDFGIPSDRVYNAVVAWIDYNNDGNMDLLYMGTAGGNEDSDKTENVFFQLYENMGKANGYAFRMVDKDTGLKGLYIEQENQYGGVVVVGDYNNDGYADVLATGQREGVRYVNLYKNNNGDGTFTLQENIVEGSSFEAMSGGGVLFADLNNDGYLDIVSNGWSDDAWDGYSALYLNKKDGTFKNTHWTNNISTAGQTKAGQVFAGDFNNDGYLDIVIPGERYDGGYWPRSANFYYYESDNQNSIKYKEVSPDAIGVDKMKKSGGDVIDLNADGRLDIIMSGESDNNRTTIYMDKGDGTYELRHDLITAARAGAVVSMADYNNDGYADAVVMGYNNNTGSTFAVWKNNGNLTKNTPPKEPKNLKSTYSNGKMTFTWDAGSDNETPTGALRYNLFIKKANGEVYMVIPADIETGYLKVADHTTAINTTSYTLNIPNDDYVWGVQTIDQGKMSSKFALADITTESITSGDWKVTYSNSNKTLEYAYKNKVLLSGAYAQVKNQNEVLKSFDYPAVTIIQEGVSDNFGNGDKYTIKYSGLAGKPDIDQVLYFYPNKEYFMTEAYIQSDVATSSNYIAPIVTTTRNSFLSQDASNRVLTIPFDNDGFIRYGSYPLSVDSVSFEVTSIFNGKNRNGLVIGSVEHDTWKTGVRFSTKNNQYIDFLECYGGITHALTRDIGNTTKQHGSIHGKSLKSPKILVGYFEDWRRGMETYGEANATITTPRKWEKGTPFGWNSWGAMETKVNFEGVKDVSDFIKNSLKPKTFDSDCVYIGLDSWWNENFTDAQLKQFVDHCKANGQEAGIYWGPFSHWGDNGNSEVEGTNGQYKYKDIYLYSNGEPIKIVSRAIDPTHPGTKKMMEWQINRFKEWGFKYIKLDFINNGTLESDSFYDPNVTTGVQAYNYGMKYIEDLCGDDMFLALSIAPAFPARGNSRRISCDTWGEMSEGDATTGYMLNSLSFGWWLDRVYAFNDADHLVMGTNPDGANRARITSGVITGIYMLGDNLSSKGSFVGTEAVRQKNLKYATNPDINEIAHYGKSFYPVEGYAASSPNKSENLFMLDTEKYTYLVVFNFHAMSSKFGRVELERLGINSAMAKEIKELWTETNIDLVDGAISYAVPAKDVRVYRIEKSNNVVCYPSITKHPVSAQKFLGESVSFVIDATGCDLAYQWYKDDVVISGATTNSYTISNTALTDNGKYHCVISNNEGTVTSQKATLTIHTDETSLLGITINGKSWNIEDIYTIDCGSLSSVEIAIQVAPSAKVFRNGFLLPNNKIYESISNPGIQNVPFVIESADGSKSSTYTIRFNKYFDFNRIVTIRWNNTMIANNNSATNGGFSFTGFKWFKNGEEVSNKQSYSAGPRRTDLIDTSADYYLQMTTADGDVLRTCTSNITLRSMDVKAYPNPVNEGDVLYVEVDIDDELMNDAYIEAYNVQGNKVVTKKVDGKITAIKLPSTSGTYFLKVKSGDFVKDLKAIVK